MGEAEPFLVWLFISGAFGAICAAIAGSRGRNALGWFFVGFFFGCLPIIILLVLPNPREEEAKFRRIEDENRRLREKLRKDRMVADDRHDHVSARLGAHDRALGIDTSGMGEVAAPADEPPALAPGLDDSPWYFAAAGERVGPVTLAVLRDRWRAGEVDEATLVWRKGMGEWQPVSAVEGLRATLGEDDVE